MSIEATVPEETTTRTTENAQPPIATARRRGVLAVAAGLGLIVLLAILPLLALDVPGILPGPTYTPGTLQLLAYAMLIAALALTYRMMFGLAGLLSFGHALFFAAGAYGLGIVLDAFAPVEWPSTVIFLVSLAVTFVLGTVLAATVGALALRVSGISFAMVTLAFAQAGSVLIRRNPERATGGDEGLSLDIAHVPDFLVGVVNTRNLYWLALAVLVLVYLAVFWVERSRAGRVAEAVRENELRVRVLGIRPFGVKLLIFVVASVLAVVVGMVYLLLQSGVSPRIATADFTLTLLVIVVLGGVGFRWGAVIGGIVYAVLDQRLTALAGSELVAGLPAVLRIPLSEPLFILGTLFILVVLFLPGGIAGTVHRVRERRRGRDDGQRRRSAGSETA
ncbi:branched-chain amino acid transport system permease protein [Microbacterium resistens]|uniref:Branched-chain amino acid transport system permease protein n=1 Tax=Microbacterium resistens TaxID=156977 RepID=A0ABU1S8M3_9MICO|nr:branched-chain amino acid ABC transporter permease [Microbacterium resistens]MDR6865905.1 branched-chain amino acid transport system permease protein [Microbacterium resistens]